MLYVAVDIGCIECGEESAVLGIFTDQERAQNVCAKYKELQRKNWSGQHEFSVYAVPLLDEEIIITYE